MNTPRKFKIKANPELPNVKLKIYGCFFEHLAKHVINTIKTNKGNKLKGQPAGTNKEINPNPYFWKPNIVAPKMIVKLIENVKIKDELNNLYQQNNLKLLVLDINSLH